MVNLLLDPDGSILTEQGKVITIYDPTCGTGGMLSEGQNWITQHNSKAEVLVYGQDYNKRAYAMAASDLLMRGNRRSFIAYGNTLTQDQFDEHNGLFPHQFDYLLANPPFGVDWKGQQNIIEDEAKRGALGRFPVKLPRVNDGALLFLLHMISKFQKLEEGGSRAAVVFNGSPLFTGSAGSGESEIRRYILENDWLEAIIALPEQMFYNTGIGTFIWIVSNRKVKERRGKVQLVDARDRWTPMRRSLGDKRRYISDSTIDELTLEHGHFLEGKTCRIFESTDFGYRRVTVERPLRLRFQISPQNKDRFLDVYPHFLDAIQNIEHVLGNDIYYDWNAIWIEIESITMLSGIKWTAGIKKDFRKVFTITDLDATPVIAKRNVVAGQIGPQHFPKHAFPEWLSQTELGQLFGFYPDPKGKKERVMTLEPDPNLRDFENIPLKEDIVSFFEREVKPFVADAWMDAEVADEKDGGTGKVGYEINFNRVFFKYQAPRPLEEINAELKTVEERILELLQKVTA
jgi:type I restriction enzyme M protein